MKRLLAFLPAAALLASCGAGLSADGSLYVNPSSVKLTSEFHVDNVDFRNGKYSGPVICDDRTTNLQLSFDYTGDIHKVDVLLEGSKGERNSNVRVTGLNNTGRHIDVFFDANAGSVPLSTPKSSLQAQGITVTPIVNPTIIGATRVLMIGKSSTNSPTGELRTNYVPVVDNCPR